MSNFIFNLNPIIQALLATLFTWAVTALGAALVFMFKKIHKNILDSMLGIAAGVMIAASFWSLLSPAIEKAQLLNMNSWIIAFLGFFSGGLLLFISDNIYKFYIMKNPKNINETKEKSFKRCLMLIFSITLHNIPEGLAVGVAFGSLSYDLNASTLASALAITFVSPPS